MRQGFGWLVAGVMVAGMLAGCKPNPPKEQGFQVADLTAMRQGAVDAVTAAEDALAKAKDRVAMHDDLLADAAVFQPQIEANLAAAAKAAKP